MIHANLVDGGVFFGVAALTLLLMMFLYAVITADPEEAARTEASLMPSLCFRRPHVPVQGGTDIRPPRVPHRGRAPGGTDLCGHTCARRRP